jgi:1-aminocyclopropane-1-carboxylate deaminase
VADLSTSAALLSRLSPEPVLGVSMAHVLLLRLDRTGGLAPGNKSFKLQGNIAAAQRGGSNRLVSFGGTWSNHLHALAAAAHEQGMESVGLVRGGEQDTAMLADARAWGMRVELLSRSDYRRRNDPDYLRQVAERYAPCLLIPEGGANSEGVAGCVGIADLVREHAPEIARVVLAVGTGTTLAGLAAGLGSATATGIVGISVLRGAHDLEQRVQNALAVYGEGEHASWEILHDHHCGGYARVSPALREFILAFEAVQGIALDPVYTGKMLFAVHQLCASGQWDSSPLLAVHTGGLQGRRGFSW